MHRQKFRSISTGIHRAGNRFFRDTHAHVRPEFSAFSATDGMTSCDACAAPESRVRLVRAGWSDVHLSTDGPAPVVGACQVRREKHTRIWLVRRDDLPGEMSGFAGRSVHVNPIAKTSSELALHLRASGGGGPVTFRVGSGNAAVRGSTIVRRPSTFSCTSLIPVPESDRSRGGSGFRSPVEDSFRISSGRAEPGALAALVVGAVTPATPTAPGGSDMGSSGGAEDGAGLLRDQGEPVAAHVIVVNPEPRADDRRNPVSGLRWRST